ncbi:MAG TPA: hypothetical protein VMT99_00650 [Candidatus Paceibacterota bacterium]|nr:hypothetical protein [Candidatus Paceibacterota bacterium]
MTLIARISKNVVQELKTQAEQSAPDVSNPTGDLFIMKSAPLAGIRLKVPLEAYLANIPRRPDIVPTDDELFAIVVNSEVSLRDGKTFIDGQEVDLLPKL